MKQMGDNLFIEEERKREEHFLTQSQHREYETTVRGIAKIKANVQTINSDHMSKKFMIKLQEYTKKNFKITTDFKILPGGNYISKSNQTRYYITSELYGENCNTILSQFHAILLDLVRNSVNNVYFILDNHSTNKNFVVLAYMDYMVIFLFLLFFLDY